MTFRFEGRTMTITRQEIEYYAEQIVDFTRGTIGWRDPAEIRLVIDRAFEIAEAAIDKAEAGEFKVKVEQTDHDTN
jgi:hypothetical protein